MTADIIDMGMTPYGYALDVQRELAEKRRNGEIPDTVLLLEHPPVVSLGTQGDTSSLVLPQDRLRAMGIDLYPTDRGGAATYHGPGQLVVYPIFDLHGFGKDSHQYVRNLEEVGIRTAASFVLEAGRVKGSPGVWVEGKKIASIGVSMRRWITRHGMALNVNTDLSHFAAIHPCGMESSVMASLSSLGERELGVQDVLPVLVGHLADVFGLEIRAAGLPVTNVAHPPWMRVGVPDGEQMEKTRQLLSDCNLETVCQEADCPNAGECFSRGVATFLILGNACTRKCLFCAVQTGTPAPPDPDEPRRVAEATERLALQHVVVTSVTRDDLPDGGAAHFAATIRALRKTLPQTVVEVLVPDFGGDSRSLDIVLEANPRVLAHNVETVPRLYDAVRPGAAFERSLELLARAKDAKPSLLVKSGIMVGLGETIAEVLEVMKALRATGCDILTVGQYLSPTPESYPMQAYITPRMFANYEAMARAIGFKSVVSGPLVRSSYAAVA